MVFICFIGQTKGDTMIDISTYAGDWPFRSLPGATLNELSLRLRVEGIRSALVSPIEGIFYDETQLANEKLFEEFSGFLSDRSEDALSLFPVAVLNPRLPNWRRNLVICHEKYKINAVKLYPNYHQYEICDSQSLSLLGLSGEMNLPVIIQLRVQDVRAQNPIVKVPDVDALKVIESAREMPETKMIIGGIKWGEAQSFAEHIIGLENLWIDISNIEYTNVLRRLIRVYGIRQLPFGTHAPFFVIRSAILKLKEAELDDNELDAITKNNACLVFNIPKGQKR